GGSDLPARLVAPQGFPAVRHEVHGRRDVFGLRVQRLLNRGADGGDGEAAGARLNGEGRGLRLRQLLGEDLVELVRVVVRRAYLALPRVPVALRDSEAEVDVERLPQVLDADVEGDGARPVRAHPG